MDARDIQEQIAKKLCLWDGIDWAKLPESTNRSSKDRQYYCRRADEILELISKGGQ